MVHHPLRLAVGVWLASYARPLGLAYAVSYWWFGASRAAGPLATSTTRPG